MKNLTYYTLSLSGGKDSVALFLSVLKLVIKKKMKLHEVVCVDLGDEFQAVYDVLLYVASICMKHNIKFTVLTIPETPEYKEFVQRTGIQCSMFEFLAFYHVKKTGEIGYGWCGKCRWGTTLKKQILNRYYQSKERFIVEYVGIAADESHRIDVNPLKNYAKSYPLIKWGMKECDCLQLCNDHGVFWEQNGIHLYDILDRVSCQHCQNKNLKELRNIKEYIPELWEDFKRWQTIVPFPFRSDGSTIFDLDLRFEDEKSNKTDDGSEEVEEDITVEVNTSTEPEPYYLQLSLFDDML